MGRILDDLKEQVEAEGFVEGTTPHEERTIALKVELCQQMKNNPCNLCPYLDSCSLAQQFYTMIRTRNERRK